MRYLPIAALLLACSCKKAATPLTAEERARATAALDRAEARVKERLGPLAEAWPALTERAIDVALGEPPCPATGSDWVLVDARHEPLALAVGKMTEPKMERAPELGPLPGLVPLRPPPAPSWAIAIRKDADALRSSLDQPVADHAKVIADAEALARRAVAPDGVFQFALVDVWYPPLEKPLHASGLRFEPGFVQSHAIVWDAQAKRVACAGMATTSSPLAKGQKTDPETLRRDLQRQVGLDLAASVRALPAPTGAK